MRQKEHIPPVVYGLSFFSQLISVPVFVLYVSFTMGTYFRDLMRPYRYLEAPADLIYLILPDIVGFTLGYIVRHFPAAVREPARWIWILPFTAFAAVFVASWFTNLHQLFYALLGTQGSDYQGVGIFRLIFPASAICLYSIEVRGGDKQIIPTDETGHPI
jgi:hypothetical protein